ncbi:hypothetical protein HWV62_15713 [Athelia sp. TMB]|nr:hypothetical protein HWV62_15713 [Athelia sp. TMB]
MFEPVRGGTRGGQAEFKWSDVSADKDRENYLGHSINAPTGRWQKNKDVHWYNRDKNDDAVQRAEEIRKVKEAEAEALAAALGFEPAPKTADGAPASGSNAIAAIPKEPTAEAAAAEKEEKRRKKAERKEEKRAKKEAKRAIRASGRDSDDDLRPHRRDRADELLNRSPSVHTIDVQEAPRSLLHAATGLLPTAIRLLAAIITIGEETGMKAQEVTPTQRVVRVGHGTET